MNLLYTKSEKLETLKGISKLEREGLKKFLLERFRQNNNRQQLENLASGGIEAIVNLTNFFHLLGDFYSRERNCNCALKYYQLSLGEDPDNYWSNIHLAAIYRQYLNDSQLLDIDLSRKVVIDRVLDIYNRLLDKQPNDTECLRLLGKFYGHIGKSDLAIAINSHLAEIIQTQPNNFSPIQSIASPQNILRFLVLGSMKSGTTSLFEAIGSHPDFVAPIIKEIQFFALFIERGYDWYFSHFPKRNSPYFTGESSTSSLDYLHVPELIKKSNLDLKFLIILRDPIARIISNFYHLKKHHQLRGERELNAEINRQLDVLENYRDRLVEMAAGKIAIDSQLPFFQDYNQFFIMRSLYVIFLRNWLNFFPPEKFMILRLPDFTEKPKIQLKKIYSFLEVSQPDKYKSDPLLPETQARLINFLQPFSQILKTDFQLDFDA
jgi:tetratricopeptide (TPR) repeat protein